MPFSADDALGHTGLANTPARRVLWADVANHVEAKTGDPIKAARFANLTLYERLNRAARARAPKPWQFQLFGMGR